MGYMMAMGPCIGCNGLFSYNPNKVPSVTVNGSRKAICLSCVEAVNPERIKNGLAPIVPAKDAYAGEEVA